MTERHVLAIDHGTSGIKTSIVSCSGQVVATRSEDTPTYFLPGGGAEQDPDDWWQALLRTSRKLLDENAGLRASIDAVCVSSTFSSTVAVDRDGNPVMNCLTWMDSRGAPHVKDVMWGHPRLRLHGLFRPLGWIRSTGGFPSVTGKDDLGHVLWLLHERPELYRRTYKFLPSKDYLNLKLTGRFAASFDSIMLFWLTDTRNVERVHYDEALIRWTGLDRDKLPELTRSIDVLGCLREDVAREMGLPRDVKVVAGSPDHQAAAVGSGAVADYEAHLYVGTSSWIQCTVPRRRLPSHRAIGTLPTAIPGKYYCANEQDMAGGCLSHVLEKVLFAPDGLVPPPASALDYEAVEAHAARVPPGSDGLIYTPWLNGERTPVDSSTLRGGLLNVSQSTTQDHVLRAVLEGVACNTRWSLEHVERYVRRRLDPIRIIGGGALSDTWCQIFADVLERRIERVRDPRQANARGAAFIAAVGLGAIRFEDVSQLAPLDRSFDPDPANRDTYDRLFREFVGIYRRNRAMYRRLNRDAPA